MVTEIETEVWTCIDLLTIFNKISYGGPRCAKIATVQICGKIDASVNISTKTYIE